MSQGMLILLSYVHGNKFECCIHIVLVSRMWYFSRTSTVEVELSITYLIPKGAHLSRGRKYPYHRVWQHMTVVLWLHSHIPIFLFHIIGQHVFGSLTPILMFEGIPLGLHQPLWLLHYRAHWALYHVQLTIVGWNTLGPWKSTLYTQASTETFRLNHSSSFAYSWVLHAEHLH